jgi:hypothetical protein
MNTEELKRLDKWLDEHLKKGYIRPSGAKYAAPAFWIDKKMKGDKRLCLNYRDLNNRTKKDTYPLPLVSQLLMNLRGACLVNCTGNPRVFSADPYPYP